MKKVLMLLLLCVLQVGVANAQLTQPRRDTIIQPKPLQLPTTRQLPPSLRAELRQNNTKARRAVVFRDTIAASALAKQHFNDSNYTDPEAYADSAMSLVDSAVSLTHKEWLDSQVVELPEIARFGNKIHYNYPIRIQTEAERRDVPFDTSVLSMMNPISRENLPYFDESPLPLPLTSQKPWEAMVQLGLGSLELPNVRGMLSYTTSTRAEVRADFDVALRSMSKTAVGSLWSGDVHFETMLGFDPSIMPKYSSILGLGVSTSGKEVQSYMGSRTLSSTGLNATLHGGVDDVFEYDAQLGASFFTEKQPMPYVEPTEHLGLAATKSFEESSWRILASLKLDHSGVINERDTASRVIDSRGLTAQQYQLGVGQRFSDVNRGWEWSAGAQFNASGVDSSTMSALMPFAKLRIGLNPRWEIGASFEPELTLSNAAQLAAINPFFVVSSLDSFNHIPRSVAFDRVNILGYTSYMLSPDDEVRADVRFITRDDEPVFMRVEDTTKKSRFSVTPESTRRFIFGGHGNFLVLSKDLITLSFEYRSATISGLDVSIPYEPTFKAIASYTANELIGSVTPTLEYSQISRRDRSIGLVNLRVAAPLTDKLSLFLSGENLFNAASDYWDGYVEQPLTVSASVRYRL